MKRMWWAWVAVFVLGIGIGSGIARLTGSNDVSVPIITLTQPATTPKPTQPDVEQTVTKEESAMFPFALEYTSLVAEKLIAYEGAYLENGLEENVQDIAALVLRNTGTTGIEYVQVVLVINGQEMSFDATYIPPKSTVLLLEENQQPYSNGAVMSCRCRTVIPGVFDRSERTVEVKETGMCTLEVTNLTDQKMDAVRIFDKHHEGESDLYVGGITYSTVIPDLEAGETRSITPYRYAAGYSMVVAVVTQ